MMFKGIFPPIPTPFDRKENIDFNALKFNIQKWNNTDLSGLVVLGSNGEFVYLSREEKERLICFTREHLDSSKDLIAGTGCESARETIKLTNKAAHYGAKAALVLTPNYYKKAMNNETLKNFYFRVAEESKIPVLLYNMPANAGINMPADLIAELSEHPNIIGIKESSGNITQISQIIHTTPEDFVVLAGSASFLFPSLMMGAKGGVLALSNVLPELCIEVYKQYTKGNYEKARKIQLMLIEPNTAVTSGFGVPGLKAAMDMMGFIGGEVRNPLLPLDESKKQKLKQIFEKVLALKNGEA